MAHPLISYFPFSTKTKHSLRLLHLIYLSDVPSEQLWLKPFAQKNDWLTVNVNH